MCTVSWLYDAQGYEVFFSRDEKLTRPPALAPRILIRNSVRCVSPMDTEGGGTWIGVNELGATVCLLNAYTGAPAGAISRGLLVESLLHCSAVETVAQLRRIDLTNFAPFKLLALEQGASARIFTWDGVHLLPVAPVRNLLTSSSVDDAGAACRREEVFPAQPDSKSLLAFHQSHSPERGAHSVCMHRADAATVSFSRIRVTRSRVQFQYLPGAPCTTRRWTSVDLARSLHIAC